MRRGDLKAAAQAEKLMDFALALGFKIHSHCLRHSDGVSMLTLAVMLRQPGAKELRDDFVKYEAYLPADVEFHGKCDPHEPAIKDMARLMLSAGITGATLHSNETAATVNVCRKCGRVIVRSAEDACRDVTPRQCLRWTLAEVGDDEEVRELIGPTPLIPLTPPELHDPRAQADTAIRNLDDLGNLRRASFPVYVHNTREEAERFSRERLVPRMSSTLPHGPSHGDYLVSDHAPPGMTWVPPRIVISPLKGICTHCDAIIRVNAHSGPVPFWEVDEEAEAEFRKANPDGRRPPQCSDHNPALEHEPKLIVPEGFEGPTA